MATINRMRPALALGLLAASTLAWPQAHQKTFDDYILRSSVVNTLSIPAESAQQHGITRAADTGILNVTVLKKGSELTGTQEARVEAFARDLLGRKREIDMRETEIGQWVSYSGTFTFAPREVLDFVIHAQPAGSDEWLDMTYRERVWQDVRP